MTESSPPSLEEIVRRDAATDESADVLPKQVPGCALVTALLRSAQTRAAGQRAVASIYRCKFARG